MSAPLETISGTKTIAVTDTPERLSTDSRVVTGIALLMKAGGPVYVGDSNVDTDGWPVGRGIAFAGIDLARVYVYGPAGSAVRWIATAVTD